MFDGHISFRSFIAKLSGEMFFHVYDANVSLLNVLTILSHGT